MFLEDPDCFEALGSLHVSAQADLHRTQPPSVAENACNRVSKQLNGLNLLFTGGVFRDTEALLCELRYRDISCHFSSACASEAL